MAQHGKSKVKAMLMVWLKRILYWYPDQLTAISDCLKQNMLKTLWVKPERVAVVYNPVVEDSMFLQAQEPVEHIWFQSSSIPIILGVGRLVPQKDFTTLIKAFALVRQSHEARLIILGEGYLRAELETLLHQLGLQDDVWMPGFDKNPFRYMSKATLFVFSSKSEGLGNALIQAMALGTPVISTNCPCGPSESIASPGQDGILLPVGDHVEMANAISYLLDNPEIRGQIGNSARLSAERFRSERIIPLYMNAILGVGAER